MTITESDDMEARIEKLTKIIQERSHTAPNWGDYAIGLGVSMYCYGNLLPEINIDRPVESALSIAAVLGISCVVTGFSSLLKDYVRSSHDPVIADAKSQMVAEYKKWLSD